MQADPPHVLQNPHSKALQAALDAALKRAAEAETLIAGMTAQKARDAECIADLRELLEFKRTDIARLSRTLANAADARTATGQIVTAGRITTSDCSADDIHDDTNFETVTGILIAMSDDDVRTAGGWLGLSVSIQLHAQVTP
jgi:hypothetical protein